MPAAIVRLANTYTRSTGTLIGAVSVVGYRAANQGDLFFTGPTIGYYERSIFSLIHP